MTDSITVHQLSEDVMPLSRQMAKAEGRQHWSLEPHIGLIDDRRWLKVPEGEPALQQRWLTRSSQDRLEFAGRYADLRCVLAINYHAYLVWPDQQAEIADRLRKPREGIDLFENPLSTVSFTISKINGGVALALFPRKEAKIRVPMVVAENLAKWFERAMRVEPGPMTAAVPDSSHRSLAMLAAYNLKPPLN